ncbi:tryptophan-rich sensory protein [Candidatus Uhrbacteria bacterium]|nr:tryptophan-rich sensory protein [Candidatus Uhrbacteria bacterium]
MKISNALKLIIAVVVCELAGIVGAVFTAPAIQSGWYASLAKPALNPPSWLFGPVWTTLYALMGVAAWFVWRKNDRETKNALGIFVAQLFLNAIWSPIFFGARSLSVAFAVIVLLWTTIVATIIMFSKVSKIGAWLLVPYIIWVSVASYLNYAIWTLNR